MTRILRSPRGRITTRVRVASSAGTLAVVACTLGLSNLTAVAQLKGDVRIDGSSTVAPISSAAKELFKAKEPDVRITVATSGTGGGFKKFLDAKSSLRTDINDASRPIDAVEVQLAGQLGIEFIELPIAMDGMAVVVHPSNSFCDHLTIAELKRIWEPESKINNWSQVRAGFPDLPLKLYGAGTDSGTFDYFTEAIVGKARASRADYTASENDNALVLGVSGDKGSLGYFGFSYYENNTSKLKLLGIDPGDGKPVKPALDTIRSGAYRPLSRPLFLYVNRALVDRPEVQAFLDYCLDNAKKIVEHPKVGYVALSEELYNLIRSRLDGRVTGSAFHGSSVGGKSMTELYGHK